MSIFKNHFLCHLSLFFVYFPFFLIFSAASSSKWPLNMRRYSMTASEKDEQSLVTYRPMALKHLKFHNFLKTSYFFDWNPWMVNWLLVGKTFKTFEWSLNGHWRLKSPLYIGAQLPTVRMNKTCSSISYNSHIKLSIFNNAVFHFTFIRSPEMICKT